MKNQCSSDISRKVLKVSFTISRSSRQSYGDDAIGYVQLKRDANLCMVKCKICPEHRVHSKSYSVTMIVDEEESIIVSVKCHDCAASEGGCKHAVAFLMWVHRRSEEPSCTSVECYWKKSNLAKVGTSLKFITTKEMAKGNTPSHGEQRGNIVFSEFLKEAKKMKLNNCQIMKHQPDFEVEEVRMLSLHQLLFEYNNTYDSEQFLTKISKVFEQTIIKKIEQETRDQHTSPIWYELRYGRITASKAYDVSRCKTADGALVSTVMGARIPDTPAMKRGRSLEDAVRKVVENKLGKKIHKCGLFISSQYPFIAGSPDGICENYVIEIKCPSSEKTLKNYIKDDKITMKYATQVQLQMYVTNYKKCYFCVADPNFETNNTVKILTVEYDEEFVTEILSAIVPFWKNNIYPILCNSSL